MPRTISIEEFEKLPQTSGKRVLSIEEFESIPPIQNAVLPIAPTNKQTPSFLDKTTQYLDELGGGVKAGIKYGVAKLPIRAIGMAGEGIEAIGFSETGRALSESARNVTAEQEKMFERAAEKAPIATNVASGALQLGQIAAAPIGKTFAGMVGRGAATGQALGMLEEKPEETGGAALGERLTGGLDDAAFGALFPAVFYGGKKVVQSVGGKTSNRLLDVMLRKGERAADPNIVSVGQKAQSVVGEPLTKGQRTQSRTLQGFESLLQRAPMTDDMFAQKLDRQIAAVDRSAEKLRKAFARGTQDVSPEYVGRQIENTFNKAVMTIKNGRAKQAALDFGVVDKLSGNARVIPLPTFMQTAQNIVEEGSSDLAPDLSQKLAKAVAKKAQAIIERKGNVSALEMQKLLEQYGKSASGDVRLFGFLEPQESKSVARRLFGALQNDLDQAVDGKPITAFLAPEATALKTARDNYRLFSKEIEALSETTLGRILNTNAPITPEVVIDKVRKMKPSELRTTLQILDKTDKQAADLARRATIYDLLIETTQQKMGATRPQALQTALRGENKETLKRLDIVFKGKPKLKNDLLAIAEYSSRLTPTLAGSPTQPLGEFASLLNDIRQSITLEPNSIMKVYMTLIGNQKLADRLINDKNISAAAQIARGAKGKPAMESAQKLRNAILLLDSEEE